MNECGEGPLECDVVAVVLTCGAPQYLRRTVAALLKQEPSPAEVIVIDNAGTPAAETVVDALHDNRLSVIRMERNLGPGGGHAHGFEVFLRTGRRWVWVMDDDILPAPGALGDLLRALGGRDRCVARPTQLGIDGSVQNYPGWYGFLFPRSVVELVGVPRADLVWWTEDAEYLQWRLPRAGIEVVTVERAVVEHTRQHTTGARPPWKTYYEARNSVYYRIYLQRCRHAWKLARTLVRMLGGILMREKGKLEHLRLFVIGFSDGLRKRLGLRVELTP